MEKSNVTRRAFTKTSLGSLLTYSLLETLCCGNLFADEVKPIAAKWLADLHEFSRDVKRSKLKQVEWQSKVEELFSEVDMADLLQFLDFDKLTGNVDFVDKGARSLRFKFPEVEGLPKKLIFGQQIFALKKDRSVIPHGHNNMATAFLILKGDLRGRHYDRLEDADDYFIIRPTIDRKFGAAEFSTVSDYRDNIHWFQAITEPAFIFNIHVLNVNKEDSRPLGRVYLNPLGEELDGGLIRAPRIEYEESVELFG